MAETTTGEPECSLLRVTRSALLNSEKSDYEIYRHTGLHPRWLNLMRTGKVRDPSVNRVQQLYEFLRGEELALTDVN